MKKQLLSILALATLSLGVNAQNVSIPDANFKAYLVGNSAINTNNDTEIQVSEANAFAGTIDVYNSSISSMTGLETFTALTELDCSYNQLTTLDVSANTNLEILYCSVNQITSLDISANTALEKFYCNNNQLTNLNLSNNVNLIELRASYNNLTGLDVSSNLILESFQVRDNALTTLDVSANLALRDLRFQTNQLTSLNVANGNNLNFTTMDARFNSSLTCINHDTGFDPTIDPDWRKDPAASWSDNCPSPCFVTIPDANFKSYLVGNSAINTNSNTEIECAEAANFSGTINVNQQNIADLTGIEAFVNISELNCTNNQLTSLDLSANTSLGSLYCGSNNISNFIIPTSIAFLDCSQNSITSIDVSANIDMFSIACYNNALTSLNVANGANTGFGNMNALNNPNLTCIEVDNVNWSTNNWTTSVDATASFSLNCGGAILVNSISVQGQGNVSTISTNGGTLQMQATVLPANADDVTYTWSVTNGTGSATVDVNGLLTAATDGTVTVKATANDGSGISGSAIITITNQTSVGINDLQSDAIKAYPNPTNGVVTFKTEESIQSIKVYNLTGQKVLEFNNVNTIDISSLPNGTYTAKLIVGSSNPIIERLIKY